MLLLKLNIRINHAYRLIFSAFTDSKLAFSVKLSNVIMPYNWMTSIEMSNEEEDSLFQSHILSNTITLL